MLENDINYLIYFSSLQERPSPPTNLQVVAEGPQILTITWDEPEITNGGIQNYTVDCRETNDVDVLSYYQSGVTDMRVNAFSLTANTSYTCSVVAFNVHGESDPAIGEAMTPPQSSM